MVTVTPYCCLLLSWKSWHQFESAVGGVHVTEFILSDSCSTCFGRYYHPSSGVQTTVTTASGNRYTILLSAAIVEELEPV